MQSQFTVRLCFFFVIYFVVLGQWALFFVLFDFILGDFLLPLFFYKDVNLDQITNVLFLFFLQVSLGSFLCTGIIE